MERIEDDRIEDHEINYSYESNDYEESDYEKIFLPDYEVPEHTTVIPRPLDHVYWRQLLVGNFLDVIFDCPHEIPEMTTSRNILRLTEKLDESHKEILYYRAIRLWSMQKIAAFRGQTDRNIRKVYKNMIENMRDKLFEWLVLRYISKQPLTYTQREFVRDFMENNPKAREIMSKVVANNKKR